MTLGRTDISERADEYVLGLLDKAEAGEIEARAESRPELKAAIAASRDRFLPLDTSAEPVAVSEDLWRKIAADLPARQKQEVTKTGRPANDNTNVKWFKMAIPAVAAMLLIVAGLAFTFGGSLSFTFGGTGKPLVVAVLIDDAGNVQAVIEDFGNERAYLQLLADIDVPHDRTVQAWTLPSRERGPVSLGLVEGARSLFLAGPPLPEPLGGQLYELTLEPAGGSPTGRPTGPILAKGLAKLPR